MQLSPDFYLRELVRSDTAKRLNIDNRPSAIITDKLYYLCQFVLQPIRDRWGKIEISSGYRCKEVNAAVGGSATSQHLLGEAADIRPVRADKEVVYNWIAALLNVGQVIEYDDLDIIHVSLPRLYKPNREALKRVNGVYQPQVQRDGASSG